ncbi:MAG: hypothetical protein KBD31_05105 [Proteobacteria bacterium]|nr:hypothetical protein [Pseudomonadota bacterium]
MNKIKIGIMGMLAISFSAYGIMVYQFNRIAQNQITKLEDASEITDILPKDCFSIQPFSFTVSISNKEKTEQKAAVSYNPLFNTLSFFAYSKIDMTINLKEQNKISISYTPIAGNKLLETKLDTNLFFNNNFSIRNINIKNVKGKFDIIKFKDFTTEINIRNIDINLNNDLYTEKSDYDLTIIENSTIHTKYTIESSITGLNVFKGLFEVVKNSIHSKELSKEDKKKLIEYLFNFIRTFSNKSSIKSHSYIIDEKDPSKCQDIHSSEGDIVIDGTKNNEFLIESQNNKTKVNFKNHYNHIINSYPKYKELIDKGISDGIQEVFASFDNVDFLSNFSLKISGKEDKNILTDIETIYKVLDSEKLEGSYSIKSALNLKTPNGFDLKCITNCDYNSEISGSVKVMLPKKSYDMLIQLAKKIEKLSAKTSLKEFTTGITAMAKSLPYETFFKLQKDDSGCEVETFEYKFKNIN